MIIVLFIIPNWHQHLVYDDENIRKRIHFADVSPLRWANTPSYRRNFCQITLCYGIV